MIELLYSDPSTLWPKHLNACNVTSSMPLPIGDDELKLKQKARRRLIGAIVLVTGLILVLPRVLDKEPKHVTQDIEVHIPSKNTVPANPDLAPAANDEIKPAPPADVAAESVKPAPTEVETPIPDTAPAPRAESPPKPAPEDKPPVTATGRAYYIQVGVFAKAANAQTVKTKLAKSGLRVIASPVKSDGAERTRIRVGPFSEKRDADEALAKVKRAGEKSAVIIALEK
jgi:DedD protein